jgi:hypothetical protein
MICLCSNRTMVGIFGIGLVGSLVIGVGYFDFYIWGMAFYSIWDVYGLWYLVE